MTTALPSVTDVARGYGAKTGEFRNLCKIFGYSAGWLQIARPSLSDTVVGRVGTVASNAKNTASALVELPKSLYDFQGKVKTYQAAKTDANKADARNEVIMQGLEIAGPAQDTLDLTNKNILPINSKIMNIFGRISFAALFLASAWKAIRELGKISEGRVEKVVLTGEQKVEAVHLAMINLAKSVSYAALGALGFLLISGVPFVAPWMTLAAATTALTFTIISQFYERTHGLDRYKA